MTRMPGGRVTRLAVIVLPLLALSLASAAPGDLDPTFGPLPLPDGIPGIVVVDVDPALAAPAIPSDFERTTAMVIQPDGKIVVSGTVGSRLGLIRLNPNGSLDTTFDGDGIVLTDFAPDHASEFGGLALAIDGGIVKIVAAVPVSGKFGVIRYNSDGTPDTTFGGTGIVLTPFVEGLATPEAVLVQPGGAILVAGSVGSDVALARYNSSGTLDTVGFGAGTGKVVADFGAFESIQAAVLQGDKILVGGLRRVTDAGPPVTQPGDFFLARFESNGMKDLTFGAAGMVTTDFEGLIGLPPGAAYSADVVTGLAVQTDGKIVAAGYFEADIGAGDTFLLARYNASDGSLDTAFGNQVPSDGRTTGPTDFGEAVVIQPDGKIVVGGSQDGDFAVAPLHCCWLAGRHVRHRRRGRAWRGRGPVRPHRRHRSPAERPDRRRRYRGPGSADGLRRRPRLRRRALREPADDRQRQRDAVAPLAAEPQDGADRGRGRGERRDRASHVQQRAGERAGRR